MMPSTLQDCWLSRQTNSSPDLPGDMFVPAVQRGRHAGRACAAEAQDALHAMDAVQGVLTDTSV